MKELTYSEIENILKKAVECAEYYQKEHLDNKEFTDVIIKQLKELR